MHPLFVPTERLQSTESNNNNKNNNITVRSGISSNGMFANSVSNKLCP